MQDEVIRALDSAVGRPEEYVEPRGADEPSGDDVGSNAEAAERKEEHWHLAEVREIVGGSRVLQLGLHPQDTQASVGC